MIEDAPSPGITTPPIALNGAARAVAVLDALGSAIGKVTGPASRWLCYVSVAIMGFLTLPVVADVLARIILRRSIQGVTEIEEYCLVGIVFFAFARIQANKDHIRIDMVTGRLSPGTQSVLEAFNYVVCTALFGLISWQAFSLAINKIGTVSPGLAIPISFVIAVAGLGTTILTLVLLGDAISAIADVIKRRCALWLTLVAAMTVVIYSLPAIRASVGLEIGGPSLGLMGVCLLFALMLAGMPIGYAMALTGFVGMWTVKGLAAALSTLGMSPYSTTASFMLVVVPLFILMGELALYSGISKDLFTTAYKWLGRLPGGLAVASVAGCAGFAAVCGDSMATAVTMSTVALPEMRERKYDPGLATGALAAGGTLGILIPPSVGFIFYAIVTEESIAKLFIAGIIPGLLLSSLYIGAIYVIAKKNPRVAPPGERSTLTEKLMSLKGVVGMLALFLLILGGMFSGLFSATEGGAVGAAGAFLIALIRRQLTWRNVIAALDDTVTMASKLLIILIGVGILGYFLAATRLPFELAHIVTGLEVDRYVVFLGVCILYLILGCLMNVILMILLTLPAIYPAIFALGFDPIWFGVISVILMEAGQITPPVGVNVYALAGIAKDVPMARIFRGIVPFFVCQLFCIAILTVFPQIATFLPNLLMK